MQPNPEVSVMKNSLILNKIASGLAFVIGAMAIFAGGQVLLGILPDYYVINWLPAYNFIVGVVSVVFSSIVIWKNNKLAMPAAIGTFGMHAIVMLILQTAYREVVAPDSIVAMVVRLTIWAVIIVLLIMQKRKNIFRNQ
jgi:hypothetical protein